ncbi:MAG TPA: hypothetical protein VMK84_07580, partial [Streptosporangiaceae bacterium]|nr:hypothetical protein [Streptosporangiaceae bacterium]
MTRTGRLSWSRSGLSRIRPEVVSSVPPSSPWYGRSRYLTNRSPAVVQDQVRLGGQHLTEVAGVHPAVLGRLAGDGDAFGPQPLDRVRLGGVQVAGRDEPGPSVAQRQQQRHRLGLQVDAGADGQAVERAG